MQDRQYDSDKTWRNGKEELHRNPVFVSETALVSSHHKCLFVADNPTAYPSHPEPLWINMLMRYEILWVFQQLTRALPAISQIHSNRRFVHEHLLSILTPFAEHVKDLEKEALQEVCSRAEWHLNGVEDGLC